MDKKIVKTERLAPEVLFNAVEEQLLLGRKASFTVTGMSMWPLACHKRDTVIVSACDPKQLKRGDIILFQTPVSNYMLHRITALRDDSFETTGDGNCFRDGWFPRSCAKAKVDAVIRNGKTINCNAFLWRLYGFAWTKLFPFRRQLLHLFKKIGFIKAKLRSLRH